APARANLPTTRLAFSLRNVASVGSASANAWSIVAVPRPLYSDSVSDSTSSFTSVTSRVIVVSFGPWEALGSIVLPIVIRCSGVPFYPFGAPTVRCGPQRQKRNAVNRRRQRAVTRDMLPWPVARNRPRSLARAVALAYLRSGLFSRHRKQI